MTQPMANARLRPIMAPIFAPVIISIAITSVYIVIAPWIPVTVVPTSFATVAIDTFMTEVSSVIRNCPVASVSKTTVAPPARVPIGASTVVMCAILANAPEERASRGRPAPAAGSPDQHPLGGCRRLGVGQPRHAEAVEEPEKPGEQRDEERNLQRPGARHRVDVDDLGLHVRGLADEQLLEMGV